VISRCRQRTSTGTPAGFEPPRSASPLTINIGAGLKRSKRTIIILIARDPRLARRLDNDGDIELPSQQR
jgi:hypothetical protein